MRLPRLGKGGRGLLRLRLGLLRPPHGDTHDRNDLTQFRLSGRAVKAAVKRGDLDSGDTPLELGSLTDDDVGFQLPGVQDPVVADKPRAILDDKQLVTELNRLGLLAALDQLGVRLKDANLTVRVNPSRRPRLWLESPSEG